MVNVKKSYIRIALFGSLLIVPHGYSSASVVHSCEDAFALKNRADTKYVVRTFFRNKVLKTISSVKRRLPDLPFKRTGNMRDMIRSWEELPAATTIPLSIDMIEALERHPTVKALRSKFGSGNDLYFQIRNYSENIEKGLLIDASGEGIQAVYLKKVIKQVFPNSEIGEKYPTGESYTGRTIVVMQVGDLAESGSGYDWKTAGLRHSQVEMGNLKTANPGMQPLKKSAVRQLLGIPTHDKVVSIYASYRTRVSSIDAIVNGLFREGNTRTIIVSASSRSSIVDLEQSIKSFKDVQFIRSSEIGKTPVRIDARYLILNETKGRMPYIHAAADVTVVLGSPNLFESLNAGTPTIFFNKAEPYFSQSNWNDLAKTAIKSGGAFGVDKADEAVQLVSRPDLSRPTLRSFEIKDDSGVSPIDRLLTNTVNIISKSTRVPRSEFKVPL